ncbi:MAG: winged helix-turn-helix domain-containing protein [Ramlibacter sp.]|nr:winged helix-turn-helix domain-containing protein [Ramlibacter sp.]
MKTRIKDLPAGYSFQYGEGKRPAEWHHVGGNVEPLAWATKTQRDLARAIFSRRRTVNRALGDLRQRKLA